MVDFYQSMPRGPRESFSARNDARVIRSRIEQLAKAQDTAQGATRPYGAARLLGQVYDGGMMGSTPTIFYLVHPVQVTGAVSEGAGATLTVDGATTVPVLVLNGVPSVGDDLTCYSVGGRWVSELGASGMGPPLPCSPCSIPTTNLTISWTNILSGPGSDMMIYTPGLSPVWTTGCSGAGGANIFALNCSGGLIELRATYFTSGSCPTGAGSFCSNLLAAPRALSMTATCSPFSLTFGLTNCAVLAAAGYTSLTITP